MNNLLLTFTRKNYNKLKNIMEVIEYKGYFVSNHRNKKNNKFQIITFECT